MVKEKCFKLRGHGLSPFGVLGGLREGGWFFGDKTGSGGREMERGFWGWPGDGAIRAVKRTVNIVVGACYHGVI